MPPQSGTLRHLNRPSTRATKQDIERYRGSKQTVANVSNLLNFKKIRLVVEQTSKMHTRRCDANRNSQDQKQAVFASLYC